VGQHLSFMLAGKATTGKPRSEPDWGKPTVRDRRGACGNVDHGGTRHPPRVSKERVLVTLHLPLCAPQIYPDRHKSTAPLASERFQMNVLVASIEDKSYNFRTTVYDVGYETEKQNFYMPRPIGDDWLQRINHRPLPSPELVRVQDRTMFVVFESTKSAEDFSAWLVTAEAEAREGYRTMRG
jgi:hypothetical protein